MGYFSVHLGDRTIRITVRLGGNWSMNQVLC